MKVSSNSIFCESKLEGDILQVLGLPPRVTRGIAAAASRANWGEGAQMILKQR